MTVNNAAKGVRTGARVPASRNVAGLISTLKTKQRHLRSRRI